MTAKAIRTYLKRKLHPFLDCINPCEDYPETCGVCPHRSVCYVFRVNAPMNIKQK